MAYALGMTSLPTPLVRAASAAALSLLTLAAAAPAHADVETRSCSAEAAANLEDAVDFLRDHREELKYDTDLGRRDRQIERIRDRIDEKIDDIWFSCAERVLCREDAPRIGLHAFGIASDKIRICYDKIVDYGFDYCEFVGVVAHEFGHAVGIPKDMLGGHSRNQDDRVYQFGYFAEDLCRRERQNRPLE